MRAELKSAREPAPRQENTYQELLADYPGQQKSQQFGSYDTENELTQMGQRGRRGRRLKHEHDQHAEVYQR